MYRVTFRCLCGDYCGVRTDDPDELHGFVLYCGTCDTKIGKILVGLEYKGEKSIRLAPDDEVKRKLRWYMRTTNHKV